MKQQSVALHFGVLMAFGLVAQGRALAAGAVQGRGQAALVGETLREMPPASNGYQAWRLPLGLTLEGKASNNLSLFLDLRVGNNNAPVTAKPLGSMDSTGSAGPFDGSEVRQPLVPLARGAEKLSDTPWIGFAYAQYASPIGLWRVGRMPTHWGLGLWRNAEWVPEGGAISTVDAVEVTMDFSSTFSSTFAWEKTSEGSPWNNKDDADSLTVQALLADDPVDPSSLGLTRQIGLAVSKYDHDLTDTHLRIVDLYGQFLLGSMSFGGEILYPSGSTRSTAYSVLGSYGDVCTNDSNASGNQVTCDSSSVGGLAALVQFQYLFGASKDRSLGGIQAGKRLPTSSRAESHRVGLLFGYASGDSQAFSGVADGQRSGKAGGLAMHGNIHPALLMFSPSLPMVPGMPSSILTNVSFLRAEYTYESPGKGSFVPAVIVAHLNAANTLAGDLPSAVGVQKSLGVEFDLLYSYQTSDSLKLSAEVGAWIPGSAWASSLNGRQTTSYGLRTVASFEF